jgi:hypothetical protein
MARMLNLLFGRRDRSTSFRRSLQFGNQPAVVGGSSTAGQPIGLLLVLTKAA